MSELPCAPLFSLSPQIRFYYEATRNVRFSGSHSDEEPSPARTQAVERDDASQLRKPTPL
jgi:hypothetical protein